MKWFQRHLNWTWVFAYLIWFLLNRSESVVVWLSVIILLLIVSGWVIKQKGRRLWWILLTIVFSPLWLSNKKMKLASSQEPIESPPIQRAKSGIGYFVQIVGGILWLGCGLYIMIYEIGVINDAFGFWLAALAFVLFPIVYAFAFFIDWIVTGTFPIDIFVLWLLSLVGMVITYAGSRIRGEE
ncbi:hypothetical protein ACFLV2_00570 [Chloroflexota bacterium]